MIVTLCSTVYALVVPGKNLDFCLRVFELVILPVFSILIPLENSGLTVFLVPASTPDLDILLP